MFPGGAPPPIEPPVEPTRWTRRPPSRRPSVAVWLKPTAVRIGGRDIRRVLMEKSSCHLYYEIDQVAAVVKIVSAWGDAQGKRPQP